jgi:HlyD family secretion protein
MKKWIGAATVLALAIVAAWHFGWNGAAEESEYRFVTVERGDLESVVSSTGTLEPITTVVVGTQVSGIISEIFADFNDRVEKGQVIARLDTTLLESAIRDAEANLQKNRAQLRLAEAEHERIERLRGKGIASEQEYNQVRYDRDAARAATLSAEVNLERARQNLAYATIYAPVSGTVIEKNVEVGQTVAASLSAPELFLIAGDLSRMQIMASVDESDIGTIREGQTVRFTIAAYPDDVFTGSVRQVRLQSTMEENVVSYTVVIDVANPERKLLPGMTATVDFLVETAADVLKVANAALRFSPSEEVRAEALQRRRAARGAGAGPPAGASGPAAGRGEPVAGGAGPAPPEGVSLLWYLDEDGIMDASPVRTGITHGYSTQISGPRIEEGMQFIAGTGTMAGGRKTSTTPFQGENGRPHGPPPPPGF